MVPLAVMVLITGASVTELGDVPRCVPGKGRWDEKEWFAEAKRAAAEEKAAGKRVAAVNADVASRLESKKTMGPSLLRVLIPL